MLGNEPAEMDQINMIDNKQTKIRYTSGIYNKQTKTYLCSLTYTDTNKESDDNEQPKALHKSASESNHRDIYNAGQKRDLATKPIR